MLLTRKREGEEGVSRGNAANWIFVARAFISERKPETAVICRTRGGIQIGSCFDRFDCCRATGFRCLLRFFVDLKKIETFSSSEKKKTNFINR